jgi:hypothetical protein
VCKISGVGVKDDKFKPSVFKPSVSKPSVFKYEISPAIPEAPKSGKENDETKLRDDKEPSLFK